jgi:hypothetical protein
MQNQELSFLNKFVKIYEELIAHEGYGDIQVSIRKSQGKKKHVRLLCGREYAFDVVVPPNRWSRYKIIDISGFRNGYSGLERRNVSGRRKESNRRKRGGEPRNFRLERRLATDRRNNRGRRSDD